MTIRIDIPTDWTPNPVTPYSTSNPKWDSISSRSGWGASSLPLILQDSFESGDFSNELWVYNAPKNASVSVANPRTGANACEMYNYSLDNNYAQRNFRLPAVYKEVYFHWYVYLPDGTEGNGGVAFTHYVGNNKTFRLWSNNGINDGNNGYNSYSKIGACTWGDGAGNGDFILDWTPASYPAATTGPHGATAAGFFSLADRGTWVKVGIYARAAQNASEQTHIIVYKNDVEVLNELADNFKEIEVPGYQWGYLMGTPNSGYPDGDTIMQIDDVYFTGVLL